jgi:Tfp pilus assembly protein PilX
MPNIRYPRHATPRGAAMLALTVALFAAMLLALVYVNRNLLFEQRSATNLVRSTQAFEAAEAGLAWAGAQLDSPARSDAACLPADTATGTATSFRARMLRTDPASGMVAVATWDDSGVAKALQAACVRGATGWACSCPAAGPASLSPPPGARAAPAFVVQFSALPQPGMVRAVATGCTSLAGDCAPAADTPADATARVTVDLAIVPALKTAPAAALTARGTIDVSPATLLRNPDVASGGIAVHTGGALGALQIEGPAGSPASAAAIAGDASLANHTADGFFTSSFGMPRGVWAAQPGVKTLRCEGDCGPALAGLHDEGDAATLVHAPADLRLTGPLVLGTPQRPLLLVVDGALLLQGDVRVHGLLYSRSLRWDGSGGAGAQVQGAAITEGEVGGAAAARITRDADVLARLQHHGVGFARVGGSWRDF